MADEEELNILGLPLEVLENIFSFLNVATLRDVALVCQQFYEVVCEVEKDKIVIEISSDDVSVSTTTAITVNSDHKISFVLDF